MRGDELPRQPLFDLRTRLLEARRRLVPLVDDLDHMPAELGLDRRGADLPRLEREGRRREGLHHRRAREIAEVAALRSRRAGGMLLRQIVEILRSEEHTSELQSLIRTSYA